MHRAHPKPTKTTASLLLALAACLLPLALPAAAGAEELNRVVLRVNDRIATLYDYQQRREGMLREAERRDMSAEERRQLLQAAPEQVFKEMFEELLLQSRADQLAIQVPEERVDSTIARMKEGYGITTDEEFKQALATSGITEEELRQQLRRNLRMRSVMEHEVQQRVEVNEEDLRRVYSKDPNRFRLPEQRRLREVVVLEESGRPLEERERIAREVRDELAKGQPESEIVKGYAAQGVTSGVLDRGWVSPGDLAPELEAAAWKLQPGAVSEPIAGRGGLHVVHLLEVRPPRVQTFLEVQETLRREEQDRVYRDEVAKYLKELQEQSYIIAKPPAEAANFRRLLGTALSDEVIQPAPATAGETEVAPKPSEPGSPGALPVPKPTDPQPPTELPPIEPPPPPT